MLKRLIGNAEISKAGSKLKIGCKRPVKISSAGCDQFELFADALKGFHLMRRMTWVPDLQPAEALLFQLINESPQLVAGQLHLQIGRAHV